MPKTNYHGKQVMYLLLILIMIIANINFICASTIKPINDHRHDIIQRQLGSSDLQKTITLSALTKNDYIFTGIHNSRADFTLPKIPVFQIIPEIQCSDNPLHCSCQLFFHFKVKALHLIAIDKQWTDIESYRAKDYNSGRSKDFHQLNVSIKKFYDKKNFERAKINDISTGFWGDDYNKHNAVVVGSTDLKITFDQIWNRVIFQHEYTCNKQGVVVKGIRYVIFDLFQSFDSPGNVQLTVKHLLQKDKIILTLKPLTEDKNRIRFNPPGLFFPKSKVPGQLHEQINRKFIFTKNFDTQELDFNGNFFLEPITCPTIRNNFVLELTFQASEDILDSRENVSPNAPKDKLLGDLQKILPKSPDSNTWIATVRCHRGNGQWIFSNNIFADKIFFNLEKNKVWLVNKEIVKTDYVSYTHDTIKYNLNLTKDSKLPTLELKNLKAKNFVKINFSENKENPYHQRGWEDISLTEALSDFKIF